MDSTAKRVSERYESDPLGTHALYVLFSFCSLLPCPALDPATEATPMLVSRTCLKANERG